jgi:hypothetical protein
MYYNGFDRHVARQQLCKHSPLLGCATMGEAVFSMHAVMSEQENVITWHVSTVSRCPSLVYISEQNSCARIDSRGGSMQTE